QLSQCVLAVLGDYFAIDTEVGGTHCSGRRLRLDAVLRPFDNDGWRDPDPAFGVEFKNVKESAGTNGFMKWAAQAVDYAHTNWDRGGYMTVFTCPPVTAGISTGGPDSGWLMAHFLGQMAVGELGKTPDGWTMRLCGDTIWSERYGIHRKWSLIPKI